MIFKSLYRQIKEVFMKFLITTSFFLSAILATGCATQVNNYFEFETRKISPLKEEHFEKSVYIKSISDNRKFIEAESSIHPYLQTISQYTPDKNKTKEEIIGRNQTISPCTEEKSIASCTADATSYSSLGENLCFKNMKAKEILKLTIEKGFEDAGYKVISYSSDITANTVVIDAIVDRFWYWLDYNGTDRFASSEITISFNAINKNTGKHNSFKISNKYSIDILNFMSPLKNTVENSLIEYSKLISKTIPEKIK